MKPKNSVYIATSLDGYIADRNGGIAWLDSVPNTEEDDMGYYAFFENIDALLMGRVTFETVLGFDVEWPYQKPVFVLSNSMSEIPKSHVDKAFLVKGSLEEVLKQIHQKGHYRIYIDGGSTIQSFLKEDRIDEMIITQFPILLGGGHSLFSELPNELEFKLAKSKVHLNQLVQSHYIRKNKALKNL